MSKRVQRNYTRGERELGMVSLALAGDNSRRASRDLKAVHGLDVPPSTIRRWPKHFPEEWSRVQAEVLPRVKADLAAKHHALADYQLEVSRKLTERIDKEADTLTPNQAIAATGKLDIGSGIHTQRSMELRGEGPVITHTTIDVGDMLKTMRERWPQLFPGQPVIESTATEVADDE